jgi:hypothetical protein
MRQSLDDVAASDDLPVLDRIAQRHEQQMIDLELRQLGDRDRQPLILHYLEERSNREIADALGISVAAVEGRLKRAKVRLRRRLLRRGVALGALLGVLVESQKSACAADALVKSTTALAMGSGGVVPHASLRELVSSEIREMALVGSKQMLAVGAAVATISITLGLCGVSGHVVGQDSPTVVAATAQAEEPQAAPVKMAPSVSFSVEALNAKLNPGNARRRAMQRILTKLEDETVLEFNEAPLSEVVDFLKSAQEIPIVINKAALDDVGLGTDTPVTISISGVSLRSALDLMLESLDLDFTIRHEVLMITTPEDAENHLDTRVVQLEGMRISSEKLIEVITKCVAPDSWDEVGGAGTITALGPEFNAIVVSQTLKVHEQIADLLDQLRTIGAEPPAVVPGPAMTVPSLLVPAAPVGPAPVPAEIRQ